MERGHVHMLLRVAFSCCFLNSYGILTCITFLWFLIHSGVVVRSARFCAPVFRHDDCLLHASENPSFSSFVPLHCRAHTPFIVRVVGMHAAHTGQPTVLCTIYQ